MYRDNRELQYHDRMNFVLNNGALGDVITSLPAMIYGRQRRHESMTYLRICSRPTASS
jgi:hypothetical protein